MNSDFHTWWLRFKGFVELQETPIASIKPLLLTFMGDSVLRQVESTMEGKEYAELRDDLQAQLAICDASGFEIGAKFSTGDQFADETIDSYYAGLVEWARRRDRARSIITNEREPDYRVKSKF